MITPYSSFTTVSKYYSKEYPLPITAYTEVTAKDLHMFLGLTSEQLKGWGDTLGSIAKAGTAVVGTVKAVKGATSGSGSSATNYVPPPPPPQSWWTTGRIIGVTAGVVALIIVAIVIIKSRKK